LRVRDERTEGLVTGVTHDADPVRACRLRLAELLKHLRFVPSGPDVVDLAAKVILGLLRAVVDDGFERSTGSPAGEEHDVDFRSPPLGLRGRGNRNDGQRDHCKCECSELHTPNLLEKSASTPTGFFDLSHRRLELSASMLTWYVSMLRRSTNTTPVSI